MTDVQSATTEKTAQSEKVASTYIQYGAFGVAEMAFGMGWRRPNAWFSPSHSIVAHNSPPHVSLDFGQPAKLTTVDSPSNRISSRRIWCNVVISAIIFIAVAVLAAFPDTFDRPIVQFVNQFVGRSDLVDRLVFAAFLYPTYSSVIVTMAVWSCWFFTENVEFRSRIVVGLAFAAAAGATSRWMQHVLPTHPRPYYDSAINFRLPSAFEQPFNTWNSFPSDHVAILGAIIALAYVARFKFGFLLAVFTFVVELARMYVGAHYLTDVMGGAALGALAVWLSQWPRLVSMGAPAVSWERASPSTFYPVAFFVSYQLVTFFGDIRSTAGLILGH